MGRRGERRSGPGREAQTRYREAGDQRNDHDLQVGAAVRRVNGVVHGSLPGVCSALCWLEGYPRSVSRWFRGLLKMVSSVAFWPDCWPVSCRLAKDFVSNDTVSQAR